MQWDYHEQNTESFKKGTQKVLSVGQCKVKCCRDNSKMC